MKGEQRSDKLPFSVRKCLPSLETAHRYDFPFSDRGGVFPLRLLGLETSRSAWESTLLPQQLAATSSCFVCPPNCLYTASSSSPTAFRGPRKDQLQPILAQQDPHRCTHMHCQRRPALTRGIAETWRAHLPPDWQGFAMWKQLRFSTQLSKLTPYFCFYIYSHPTEWTARLWGK